MAAAIHHVNLPAYDVRASVSFYTDVIGLSEAKWRFPPAEQRGHLAADDGSLALIATTSAAAGDNAGLHLVVPDPTLARINGFDHNPTVGGHVAVQVDDLDAVIARLQAAGIAYTYAPTFAIANMRHVYVYDPAGNLVEINEVRPPGQLGQIT